MQSKSNIPFSAFATLSAMFILLPVASAHSSPQCQDTSNTCTITGSTAECDGIGNGDTVSHCHAVVCETEDSCAGATIQDSAEAKCVSESACYQTSISNVDVVQCNGEDACEDSTIMDSKYLECIAEEACKEATISNAVSVECSGVEACYKATIANVENLECLGDSPCQEATISSIPQGGTVDCITTNGFACLRAEISSTNAFTLTCQGTIGEDRKACMEGIIRNPGGSVFCYGGTAQAGICDSLPITETVACVICGNEDACQDVKIVDFDGNTVFNIPNNEVFVQSTCTTDQVLSYLNKIHHYGGTTCQDSDNSNSCDVVEAYCANKPHDSYCIQEFQLGTGGSWTKTTIRQGVRDVDPTHITMSNNDDNSDKVDRESWVLSSLLIGSLLLVMLAVALHLGRKNEWSCFKKVCKRTSQEEDESKGGDDTHPSGSLNGKDICQEHTEDV